MSHVPPLILAPAAGRRVRKPDGAPLAPAGEPLPLTSYWRRRLADGDVVAVPAIAQAAGPIQARGRKTEDKP